MRTLILFTLVSLSVALPQGFLADTPEVQAEKRRFFQLYNAAAAAAAAAPDDVPPAAEPEKVVEPQATHRFSAPAKTEEVAPPQPAEGAAEGSQGSSTPAEGSQGSSTPVDPRWTGPFAAFIPAGLPGSTPVRNTADVESAISAFLRAYNAALIITGHPPLVPPPVTRWTGPFAATIPAGLPGSSPQVADTLDVQHAIAAFNSAYQRQLQTVQRG